MKVRQRLIDLQGKFYQSKEVEPLRTIWLRPNYFLAIRQLLNVLILELLE